MFACINPYLLLEANSESHLRLAKDGFIFTLLLSCLYIFVLTYINSRLLIQSYNCVDSSYLFIVCIAFTHTNNFELFFVCTNIRS